MDAFLPGIGNWKNVWLLRDLWHFHFYGEVPLALVKGRERIYLEHFWNDFAADRRRSVPEADRRLYARAYGQPGAMRAGFEYFRNFERDAEDFAAMGAEGPVHPVLVLPVRRPAESSSIRRDSSPPTCAGGGPGSRTLVDGGSARDGHPGDQELRRFCLMCGASRPPEAAGLEVPALVDLIEIDEAAIGALSPALRRPVDLTGKHGHRNGERDLGCLCTEALVLLCCRSPSSFGRKRLRVFVSQYRVMLSRPSPLVGGFSPSCYASR